MNLFVEEHQMWLKAMLDAKVDFIVIGGYSVVFHGYRRTTGDMDIWLKPDNANRDKLLPVLLNAGFDEDDVRYIGQIDFAEHFAFNIGDMPDKIDFLTRINLITYDEADAQKIMADVDGLQVPFLHMNHLILSKLNTGRAKDKADVEMLQKIANDKKEQ